MGRYAVLLLAICTILASGCRQSPSQPAVVPSSPGETKVVELAKAFLAKNGKDWGDPVKIEKTDFAVRTGEKREGIYLVTYATSDDEVKLIGERIIVVDLPGEKAEFMPRR